MAFSATDGSASASADVPVAPTLEGSVLFADAQEASRFFGEGSTGFSATKDRCSFDGMRLETPAWRIEPAQVTGARSSYFDDLEMFPPGSAVLDSALLMRGVPVTWSSLDRLRAGSEIASA